MNVRELKEELEKFDDEAEVVRAYGTMRINLPTQDEQKKYITHNIIRVMHDDKQGRCVIVCAEL